MIYRVTVKTAGSVQPSGTFWNTHSVPYCGTSLSDARIAFLREKAMDFGGGYGNRARQTDIESFEEEPEDIDDLAAEEVE